MSIENMRREVLRVYPNWEASGKKSNGQIQAVYFRLKREGVIK